VKVFGSADQQAWQPGRILLKMQPSGMGWPALTALKRERLDILCADLGRPVNAAQKRTRPRLEPQALPGRIAQRKKEKECSTLR